MNEDRMKLREELRRGTLIFDGGMGTYFSASENRPGQGCEMANLDKPILVSAIHQEYLEAGARAIKTNTFASNRVAYPDATVLVQRQIRSGFRLASRVAQKFGAHVFADIGPVTGLNQELIQAEYRFILDEFLELGATNFIFETNASAEGLVKSAEYIRSKVPEAYIIVSFAILPGGYTRDGLFGEDLIHEVSESGLVDAVGFNCICGVTQLQELLQKMDLSGLTLSVMPNSGSPMVIRQRTVYQSDPEYFGRGMAALASQGIAILGGCCGTTPKHIAALKEALNHDQPKAAVRSERRPKLRTREESAFFRKLAAGEKPIAVEFDPPAYGEIGSYVQNARNICNIGADIITIADCPTAKARMDSSMMASLLQKEGLEALPHMTCRDRNLNATQALLIGLSAVDVQNLLVVTGDPIPTAERDEVKSVYQFNSRKMTHFIQGLTKMGTVHPFHVFGALNINAINFDAEIGRSHRKLEKGMQGLFTQPILSKQAKENLIRAREELDCYILGGIMPVVSERNARYMNSEVNGIDVDPEIIQRYEGLNREEAENLAVVLCREIAANIADYVDGYYIITPFNRVNMVSRIVEAIQDMSPLSIVSP